MNPVSHMKITGRMKLSGRIKLLAALASWAAALTATAADLADAFPIDLAFEMREFPYNEPPVASPSGQHVAYVVIAPPENQPQSDRFLPNGTPITSIGASLHVVATDASAPGKSEAVCGGRGSQWSPAWSADSRRIAFYSDADGLVQLWVYELSNRQCRRVSDAAIRGSVFSGSQPRWSPDGATIYVPLDPNPPRPESGSVRVADRTAESKRGPILLYGGGEGGDATPAQAGKSGSSEELMMRWYNAALAGITVADGAVRTVVPATHATRPNRLALSPSGKWLSYSSVLYLEQEISVDAVMDLVSVPARGGEPIIVAKGLRSSEHTVNYSRLDARWHPREDRLFYLKGGSLWSVEFNDAGPQAPRQLASELGELAPAILYFTADATSLVVGTEPQGRGRDRIPGKLALVPLDGGKVTRQALPDASKWQFLDLVRANEDTLWQPDANSLSVILRERGSGEQAFVRIDARTAATTTLSKGMYRTTGFMAGGDHSSLVGVYEDIGTPPNLYRFNKDGKRGRQLSVIDPRLNGRRYGSAEVIETRTPQHDGAMASVRTTILLPPGAKRGDRLPGIVMIYSGSDLSTRASFFGGGMGNTVPSQVFTSRGYAVIMANIVLAPEGSPSYPAEQMTDEVLAQAYAVADAGYVDINRLAVSGQSYGGYSTASIVSHTNLFRAGIPVNGTFDLAAHYSHMQDTGDSHAIRWAEKGQGRMGDSPWVNPQRYIDNSPFYRVDRIRTPLFLVAGEQDDTVPYEESKKLFVGLRRLGRSVQLAIYPGEGHVISTWSRSNAIDVSQRMVEFLGKHLGGAR